MAKARMQRFFSGITKQPFVKQVRENGEPVKTFRVLKVVMENSYDQLLKRLDDDESIAQSILSENPEVSLDFTANL